MVNWLKNWAEGIIVAVIIATIIEMIIPEGNNKKYVKMIIGVYIMFSIISPVITMFAKKDLDFSLENYESYKATNTYEDLNKQFKKTNEMKIEEVYKEQLYKDIEEKMQQKGYVVNNIELEINTNQGQYYGMITKLSVNLSEDNSENNNTKKDNVNKITINKVNINGKKKNDTSKISNTEQLKKYLSNEYGVDVKNIFINNK